MQASRWIPAFIAVALTSVLVSQFGDSSLAFALKGLPLLLLIAVMGVATKRAGLRRLSGCVLVGLVFSLAADIAIEYSFLAGVALFFLAHCAYITSMGWNASKPLARGVSYLPAFALLVGMYALLIASGYVPEKMVIPVVAYMAAISLMWGRALSRAFVAPANAYGRIMALGATFFVVSDSLLAINKWVVPLYWDRFAILGTYYSAQILICGSALLWLSQADPKPLEPGKDTAQVALG